MFLGGIQQGVSVALAVYLCGRQELGGIVGLSGEHIASVDWPSTDI